MIVYSITKKKNNDAINCIIINIDDKIIFWQLLYSHNDNIIERTIVLY